MRNLLIIGAGGHGRVVADVAAQTQKYEKIVFCDDDLTEEHIRKLSYPILCTTGEAMQHCEIYEFFVAIGDNETRKRFMQKCHGARFATIVHPSVIRGTNVHIGEGTVVMAGAVVNNGCVIGDGVIINTASVVEHDSVVGDYCHIAVGTHLCGSVTVGEKSFIGAGATVINGMHITGDCVIGAGTVVIDDITAPGTYIGVPAKKLENT